MLFGLVAPFTVFRTDDPGGQAQPEPPEGGEQPNPEEETPEPFEEGFDPATLPPELQPAYQQMRNAFHGKTQTVAEERRSFRNPQSVAQAFAGWSQEEREAFFEQAGLEYDSGEEQEEELEEGEEYDFRDPRVDVLLAQQEAEARLNAQHDFEQAQISAVNIGIEALEKSTGRDFSQEEVDLVGDLSMRMLDEQGVPQVEDAYERLAGVIAARREATPRKRAVRPAPSGRPGEEEVDLSDQDTRRRALAAEIEAGMEAEQA